MLHRIIPFLAVLLLSIALGIGCTGPGGKADPINDGDAEVTGQAVGSSAVLRTSMYEFGQAPVAAFHALASAPYHAPRHTWVFEDDDVFFAGTATGTAGPSPSPSPSASPSPTGSPDPADLDFDGIPDAGGQFTVNSSSYDSPIGSGSISGTIALVDENTDPATGANGAYSGSLHLDYDLDASLPFDWTRVVVSVDGSFVATPNVAAGTFQIETALVTRYTITRAGGTNRAVEDSESLITYSPAGPWAPGQPVAFGAFTLTGTSALTVDGHRAQDAITTTITPLVYDDLACRSRFTDGSLLIAFTAGGVDHSVTADWQSCGQVASTYQ